MTERERLAQEYEFLEKPAFDALARSKQFKDGPFVSSFGDGPGDPYTPERYAVGELGDGRKVFTQVQP